MAQNDILQVVVEQHLPGDSTALNVFYLKQTSALPTGDGSMVDDIAEYIDDLYANIDSALDSEITYGEAQVNRRDEVLNVWEPVGSFIPSGTPAVTQEMVSHGVTLVLRAVGSLSKVIARKFLSGFGEQEIAQSVWSSAILAAGANFLFDWVTSYTATTGVYQPGVWSTARNQYVWFTGVTVANVLAGYQRRRKPGVGI